jgi:hypothetical protein
VKSFHSGKRQRELHRNAAGRDLVSRPGQVLRQLELWLWPRLRNWTSEGDPPRVAAADNLDASVFATTTF